MNRNGTTSLHHFDQTFRDECVQNVGTDTLNVQCLCRVIFIDEIDALVEVEDVRLQIVYHLGSDGRNTFLASHECDGLIGNPCKLILAHHIEHVRY
ncbi:hypothetical protein D3C78_641140 [compost metagenome]